MLFDSVDSQYLIGVMLLLIMAQILMYYDIRFELMHSERYSLSISVNQEVWLFNIPKDINGIKDTLYKWNHPSITTVIRQHLDIIIIIKYNNYYNNNNQCFSRALSTKYLISFLWLMIRSDRKLQSGLIDYYYNYYT